MDSGLDDTAGDVLENPAAGWYFHVIEVFGVCVVLQQVCPPGERSPATEGGIDLVEPGQRCGQKCQAGQGLNGGEETDPGCDGYNVAVTEGRKVTREM